jgi:nitrogen regulatory protein P-II 2
MKLVTAIIRQMRLYDVCRALAAAGVSGATITEVEGSGHQKGRAVVFPGTEEVIDLLPRFEVEVAVPDEMLPRVLEVMEGAAATGHVGDGKILVCPLEEVIRVRTGESGEKAL